ncbi:MAG: hypothetical protein IT323_05490 [Anaerolineae bacterium]|nr:hypothetical protein [Anaerolineae bacterium]
MKRKHRLIVAVPLTTAIWLALYLHAAVQDAWTPGAHGNWIPVYPPPLEIIFLTVCAVFATLFVYRWYRYDRVERFVSAMNDEERRHALDMLLRAGAPLVSDVPSEKRKRLTDDGEIAVDGDDATEDSAMAGKHARMAH